MNVFSIPNYFPLSRTYCLLMDIYFRTERVFPSCCLTFQFGFMAPPTGWFPDNILQTGTDNDKIDSRQHVSQLTEQWL